LTTNPAITDTLSPIEGDDEMVRRITARQLVRLKQSEAGGAVAKMIVAEAHDFEDGSWGARFAVPGARIDFCRYPSGEVKVFDDPHAAEVEAMRAAITLFNQPRHHLKAFGNNRMANKDTAGGVRPAKMTPAELSTAMRAANLDSADLVFLLDKPAKRILDWSNGGDIPHEARLLLETWAKYDQTVELAFDLTNDAIEQAVKNKGR
jgi:hypothetical protein